MSEKNTQAGAPVDDLLFDAAKWLHAAYDRPPQTPEAAAMLARVDAALAAQPTQAEAPSDEYVGQLEYRGNSVAYIHQKLTAYRSAIDDAWQAMRDAGCGPDGSTKLSDAIRAALATQQAGQGDEYSGWYCAHCKCGVDGSEVTFHEQHTVCGRVITNDRPPAPQQPEALSSIDYWQRRGHLGQPAEWREACRLFRVRCSEQDIAAMAKLRAYLEEGLLEARRPEALAQQERDREDAERYRWLLETFGERRHGAPQLDAAYDDDIDDWRPISFWSIRTADDIDAAIDAARSSAMFLCNHRKPCFATRAACTRSQTFRSTSIGTTAKHGLALLPCWVIAGFWLYLKGGRIMNFADLGHRVVTWLSSILAVVLVGAVALGAV